MDFNILRMGIYQIIFLDKIPKSAAVNESVNLAKRYGHSASSGLVNAVLRKVEKKDYEEMFEIKDQKRKIELTTSTPRWLIEELLKEKTIQEVEEICKASNQRPNLAIRVNTLKTNKEEVKKAIRKQKSKCKRRNFRGLFNSRKNEANRKVRYFQTRSMYSTGRISRTCSISVTTKARGKCIRCM